MSQEKHRPDIDGLRAIAVLSVLFHHLTPSILPGGFVGVDIFFVISGFLITSQVYKEACEGTFSLRQFYKRRINRIAPALVTVASATLAVGIVALSPADLVRIANSAVFAMIGLSNVFFWREYGNYFAGDSGEAPLLHTWSLGIEEQFYVVWPILIILLLKFSRRYITKVLAILTIVAVVVSQIGVDTIASASYYLLPTRFFELMIGGLLGLVIARKRPGSPCYSGFFSIVGFALIGGSLLLLNKQSSFPGVNALWPCLGSGLLIWAGNNSSTSSPRILTSRPMVFLGLISYSLYLWHWPIIAYLNYANIKIRPLVGVTMASVSILLAALSWKFVEVPMRRTGASLQFSRVFARRFAIPVVALLLIAVATGYTRGFPQRFDPRVAELERSLEAKPEVLRRGCHVPTAMYDTAPSATCRLGSDKPAFDGIVIGDSFANHFTGMIDVIAKAEGVSLMDYTMDGCPPILGYDTGKAAAYVERCRKRNERAYAMIAANHYSSVVLAGSWPRAPEAGEQLMASIEAVLKSGAELTLVLSNEGIERAASCPIRRIIYATTETCESLRQGPPEYFTEIRSRYFQVRFIDPNQVICKGNKCSPILEDTLLYRDDVHLNDIGSRLIGLYLLRRGVTFHTPTH